MVNRTNLEQVEQSCLGGWRSHEVLILNPALLLQSNIACYCPLMSSQLSLKQELYHKKVRKSMRTDGFQEERRKFIKEFYFSKSFILQLVDEITASVEKGGRCEESLQRLNHALLQQNYTGEEKEEMVSILTKCGKVFLSVFIGESESESEFALLGIFNTMIDFESYGLIDLKLQFIEYFFQLFNQQRAKRGVFSAGELKEIQYLFSNFLTCNHALLNKSQIQTILTFLKEKTYHEELIHIISEALQVFLRDSDTAKQYTNELVLYFDVCLFNLKEDHSNQVTYNQLVVLNALLIHFSSEVSEQKLEDLLNVCFKYTVSASEKIKILVYQNFMEILKGNNGFWRIVLNSFLSRTFALLQFDSIKMKTQILSMFELLLSFKHPDILKKLQQSLFFELVLYQIKEMKTDQLVFVALKLLQESLTTFQSIPEQVVLVKALTRLHIAEVLEALDERRNLTFDEMAEDIRHQLNQIEDWK